MIEKKRQKITQALNPAKGNRAEEEKELRDKHR